jgi:uncharacterized protein YbjT (DUF2867 family)
VAHAALAAGAQRAGLVSAMGADQKSRVFYSRVKGELEEALSSLPFAGLVIAAPFFAAGGRPHGARPAAAQRRSDRRARRASAGPARPRDYRPISATRVARALLDRVPRAQGREVLLSG